MSTFRLYYFFLFFALISNFLLAKPRGIALLVGVDSLDNEFYSEEYEVNYGYQGVSGVNYDLSKMKIILEAGGFNVIVSRNPNQDAILDSIKCISERLDPGDHFLFYFSGHGDQRPDQSMDECDSLDEVLVTKSGYLVDDDIYASLQAYYSKINVVMIVDACHSGTSFKSLDFQRRTFFPSIFGKAKNAEPDCSLTDNIFPLDNCEYLVNYYPKDEIELIYIGATRDPDLAYGNNKGGHLTAEIFSLYKNQRAIFNWSNYDYERLICSIYLNIPSQDVQYYLLGPNSMQTSKSIPFTLTP